VHPRASDEGRPRILPTIVVGGLALFAALTVIGWIVGAVLAALRAMVVLAIVVAAVWVLVAGRRER
jgi:hypothetical protein